MTTQFIMSRDITGAVNYIPLDSNAKYQAVLAAGVAQSITAPIDSERFNMVLAIEPGGIVWTAINDTAVAPSGVFAATTSSMNRVGFVVRKGDTISFITPLATCQIGIEFYAVP